MKKFALLGFLFLSFSAFAQPTIKILESGKRVSFRGLSVVSDKIIWASGSAGTVARSTDAGRSFTWMKVPGYEKMDFRDIEAFDSSTAIIMGITAPAVILKTTDGGQHWRKVFEDTTKGAFLDAMDFSDEKNGIIIGDPIKNSTLYRAFTHDQGESWNLYDGSIVDNPNYWALKEGEAFFASSGTNIRIVDTHTVILASGGKASRLFYKNHFEPLPIMQGKESTGANSIAVYKKQKAVVVGGDFSKDSIGSNNCVLIDLGKKAVFSIPQTPPHGYRSCVIYLDKNNLLSCGTSGIDISRDGGMNWELISKESFHVCQKARKGNAVFLAGGAGKIAKLETR
ncbi:MAG: oxidoreductase [Chitinophagaceae bacterium]|nr:oxidoreductase [Chitinophagaceae bacterium]